MNILEEDLQRWKETNLDECAVRFIHTKAGEFFDSLLKQIDQTFEGYESASRQVYINAILIQFFNTEI